MLWMNKPNSPTTTTLMNSELVFLSLWHCRLDCFILMALKAVSIWGCYKPPPQLGVGVSNSHSTLIGNLRYDYDKCRKWECCCLGVLAQRATTAVEDEGPSVPPLVDSSGAADGVHQNESKGFHKDLNLLPSELHDISLPTIKFWSLCLTGNLRI